jgi:glyoxalase family protein
VLFEIATKNPGFTQDEPIGELGTRLTLPEWFEADRERIESRLPDVDFERAVETA